MGTSTATDSPYITRNPDVCGGQPVLAGTRTPVKSIVHQAWLQENKAHALSTFHPACYSFPVMQTVKIEPNYKISIPKEARESLGLKIGDEVKITLRPAKVQTTYTPTARERRAIEKGREEIRKGNAYTLDEFRNWLLGSPHKSQRKKVSSARQDTNVKV